MLKKFDVTRTQALRLAPEGMSEQLDNEAVIRMLESAAANETPIMCFVHSPGCVQIHTGPVKQLRYYGHWYNILDPKFNLHLDTTGITSTWIVRKPTADGIVTSLELFDQEGNLIVYFFGARKPGKPELEAWRAIIDELGSKVPTE
jgi:putative hemin transport protein